MGWLFGWNTRKALADHLITGNGVKTIKHCFKGNNIWAVNEYTYPAEYPHAPEKSGKTIRYVALYLIQGSNRGRDGWGYKDLDESAGPCRTNCPLSYIELVEAHEREHDYEPVGYAPEWRAKVREAHAKSTRMLAIGQIFKLYGKEYVVRSYEKAGGPYMVANLDVGQVFRMKKPQIKDVEVLA